MRDDRCSVCVLEEGKDLTELAKEKLMYLSRREAWHSRVGKPSLCGALQREAGTKPYLEFTRWLIFFSFSLHTFITKKKDRIINH
jgi:hypothetical protein